MAKVLRIDEGVSRQGVLLQTTKYLNSYGWGLTMEDWQSIEIKQTGQSKMVDAAMELAEVYRQEGRIETMELAETYRQEGRQEERTETAGRMLAAGYGLEQICELCELSEDQVSRLRSP